MTAGRLAFGFRSRNDGAGLRVVGCVECARDFLVTVGAGHRAGYFSDAFFGFISSACFVPSGFIQNTFAEEIFSFGIPSFLRLKVVTAGFVLKTYFASMIMLSPSTLTLGETEPTEAALLGGMVSVISGQSI